LKKSSTTGKTNTVKKDLSADDICRIIEACKQAGVQEFEHSGLKLSFLPRGPVEVEVPGQAPSPVVETGASEKPITTKTDLDLMDQDALDEAEEAQMMIDDPYAFERLQIQRDIERNRVVNGKT